MILKPKIPVKYARGRLSSALLAMCTALLQVDDISDPLRRCHIRGWFFVNLSSAYYKYVIIKCIVLLTRNLSCRCETPIDPMSHMM